MYEIAGANRLPIDVRLARQTRLACDEMVAVTGNPRYAHPNPSARTV